jgi:hypothetical protein
MSLNLYRRVSVSSSDGGFDGADYAILDEGSDFSVRSGGTAATAVMFERMSSKLTALSDELSEINVGIVSKFAKRLTTMQAIMAAPEFRRAAMLEEMNGLAKGFQKLGEDLPRIKEQLYVLTEENEAVSESSVALTASLLKSLRYLMAFELLANGSDQVTALEHSALKTKEFMSQIAELDALPKNEAIVGRVQTAMESLRDALKSSAGVFGSGGVDNETSYPSLTTSALRNIAPSDSSSVSGTYVENETFASYKKDQNNIFEIAFEKLYAFMNSPVSTPFSVLSEVLDAPCRLQRDEWVKFQAEIQKGLLSAEDDQQREHALRYLAGKVGSQIQLLDDVIESIREKAQLSGSESATLLMLLSKHTTSEKDGEVVSMIAEMRTKLKTIHTHVPKSELTFSLLNLKNHLLFGSPLMDGSGRMPHAKLKSMNLLLTTLSAMSGLRFYELYAQVFTAKLSDLEPGKQSSTPAKKK